MRDASKHKYSGGNYFIGKKIRLGWYTKDRNLKKADAGMYYYWHLQIANGKIES